jgi:hypothetical protein
MGSAIRFGSSVWAILSFRKGLPTSTRFTALNIVSTTQS